MGEIRLGEMGLGEMGQNLIFSGRIRNNWFGLKCGAAGRLYCLVIWVRVKVNVRVGVS